MREEIHSNQHFKWIDVVNPSPEELEEIGKDYELHSLYLQDCLDPEHLPKIEHSSETLFIILRVYDEKATADALTVQELTRKIAIFVKDQVILTIHRSPLSFIGNIARQFDVKLAQRSTLSAFIYMICKDGVLSFEKPLEITEKELEKLEAAVSNNLNSAENLLQLNNARRKLSSFKRLFWHTSTIVQRLPATKQEELSIIAQDLSETVESLTFFCDGLMEDATSLLNLELSMGTKRTNEVIQVLTIFSVFFMPLTFIVGIYGMNFHFMPELHWEYGYFFVWIIMILVTVTIFIWFKNKKWM